jgi:hypothetical protein
MYALQKHAGAKTMHSLPHIQTDLDYMTSETKSSAAQQISDGC